MYDYRTPPKKRGPVQLRSSRSVSRPTGRSSASSSRTRRTPVRAAARPRTTTSSNRPFTLTSFLIGVALLVTAIMISYVIIFQMILPAAVPVDGEHMLLVTDQVPPVAGQQISIIRFSPAQRRLTIVSGQLPSSPVVSPSPLSWHLGVPIDQQLQVAEYQPLSSWADTKLVFRQLLTEPGSHTISLRERLSWWLFARSLPRSQVSIHDVTTEAEWARARRSLHEGRNQTVCQVAVVNATNQSGLATGLTGLLEQSGFVIIRVGDTQNLADVTEIVIDEGRSDCLAEAERVSAFTELNVDEGEMLQPAVQANIMSQYRAPIVVKIGRDIAPLLDEYSNVAD